MKSHFETLDGLRGTAAFCVVLFHMAELTSQDLAHNPLRHTHLAVDFFFALSGFVIAHAYDRRLSATAAPGQRLTLKGFLLRRLIRLHPMAVIGMCVGLLSFIFDPFVGPQQTVGGQVSVAQLSLVFGLSLLLLPEPCLPNRFGETHSLNAPAWTLFQEYIGNLLYGLFGQRLNKPVLTGLCAISGVGLLLTALSKNTLSLGWDWDNFWVAFVRLAYSFTTGVLLQRLGWKIRLPFAYIWLSLALIAVFTAPAMDNLKGLFEALCVLFVFPLILCLGAGQAGVEGVIGRLCRLTGRLSYPVYILHYPAIYVFFHWLQQKHPDAPQVWAVGAGLFTGVLGVSWLLLKYYDEPLRAYLSRQLKA